MKSIASFKDNLYLLYRDNFIAKDKADIYFNIFEKKLEYNPQEESFVIVAGKKHNIKRQQVAYGDTGTFYEFSGNVVHAKSWDSDDIVCKLLKSIKKKVEVMSGEKFNFVLINRYNDGNDTIGYHSDDEKDLVEYASIAGVSFGQERDILFKEKNFVPKIKSPVSLQLDHGSLILMKYPTNGYWKHSIPKRAGAKKPRISLTFRKMNIIPNMNV